MNANCNDPPLWSHHHHHHHPQGTHDGSTEDFSSFLNFNDIQLSLSSPLDTAGQNGFHHDSTAMDTVFSGTNGGGGGGGGGHSDDRLGSAHSLGSGDMLEMQYHGLQQSLQPSLQHGQQNQQLFLAHQLCDIRNDNSMVPPTPSSLELQNGIAGSFHSNIMMDRYHNYREEQMIFTPLVSPAVTPLDTQFSHHVPEFAGPGAYFSPLTSPALDALPHRAYMPNTHHVTQHSQSTSPIDPKDSPVTKKPGSSRRKSTTSRNPARVVRESPSMKPSRKKGTSSFAPTAELASALGHQSASRKRSSIVITGYSEPAAQSINSRDVSSNESVSPEPLSEVLMAPPPPRSGKMTDSKGGNRGGGGGGEFNAPATPASLMRLPKTSLPTEDIPPVSMDTSEFLNADIEHLMTGVLATTKNDSQKDEPTVDDEEPTPRIGATGKTSPSVSKQSSVPQNIPNSRQLSQPNMQDEKKQDLGKVYIRGKRGSVSSSPALVPRISPNVKPLLPQGMSPDTSAHLLASKSNYQNIVEGNHSQLGLSYPEHLSTDLTSKRTSHKLAEQGRRNRINNALAEIAALLPQASSNNSNNNGSDGSGQTGGAGGNQISKASTVEQAIDYIKELKRELEETKGKLECAERRAVDSARRDKKPGSREGEGE